MAPPNAQEIEYQVRTPRIDTGARENFAPEACLIPLMPGVKKLTPIWTQLAHIQQDRSQDIVLSHSICIVIAVIAVVLRFTSRRICRAQILADDYMAIFAFILAAGEIAGGLMCVHYGGGKHAVLLKKPETFAKWVIATEELYNAAITAVKMSVLLLYGRIFPDARFKIALWTVGGFVFCCGFTLNLLVVLQCRPVNASWNPAVQGHCIHLNTAFIIFGSLNALTDIIALVLPMPFIWRLHTDRTRKLQLIGVFALGSLTCGVSLYRIPQMADLSLSDAPWSDVKPCVWAVVEVCLGILGACLPTFPALFHWKGVRSSRKPSRKAHPESADSSQYAVLTPDERRSGLKSGIGNGHEDLMGMIDWADVPKAAEKGDSTK